MADGITAVIHGITDAKSEFRRIERNTDRATMYAIRQAGRVVKQVSRRNVRVYKGPRQDVPKGRLKRSISSSRNLARHGGGEYSVTVAPRGYPAQAYASKVEDQDHFMAAGHDAAASQLVEIAEVAWMKAMKGRR